MSDENTQIITTERTSRIIGLAKEAIEEAKLGRKHIKLAVDAAQKCGKLLMEERDYVIRNTKKRGQWLTYFDAHFAQIIDLRTGQSWMNLNDITYSHQDIGAGAREGDVRLFTDANLTRSGMLSLNLFPKKEAAQVTGDYPTPRTDSHLTLINRFVAWHEQMKARTSLGRMGEHERKQLITDFGPIIEFVHQLEAI